jgi:hypothetical protein
MGTATQSISNQTQRDEFANLLKEVLLPVSDPSEQDPFQEDEDRRRKRERQLSLMFREVVNQVIATDRSLSGIKPTLDAAINKAVKIAIEDKLKDWLRGGKDLFSWPFKDVKID